MTAGANVPTSTTEALAVDWTACEGRGLCIDLLPELLEPDPWGYPKGRQPATPGALAEVPGDLEPHAHRAVRMCPKLALRMR